MLSVAAVAPATAPISRVHPLPKLGAAAVVSLTALSAVDWFTPLLIVLAEVSLLPWCGVRPLPLLRRARLVLFAAATVGVVNTLFDAGDRGSVLWEAGWLTITTGNLETGASLALRVVAIALPGIVALATIDPTELADALTQQCRVSPRFAIGALAAVRLLPLLGREWRMIAMARRARGVDAGRNPVSWAKWFASIMFVLLVGAIRRGTRLATAMDARGFDSDVPRTIARPQRMSARDWAILFVTPPVCVGIVALSIYAGTFTPPWR